jgi:hypothetical protein
MMDLHVQMIRVMKRLDVCLNKFHVMIKMDVQLIYVIQMQFSVLNDSMDVIIMSLNHVMIKMHVLWIAVILQKGCIHSTRNCSDNNVCTVDSCSPTLGCQY